MTVVDRPGWTERARDLDIRAGAFIGGGFRPAADGRTFASVNPATGATLADVASCDAADVEAAITAARDISEALHYRDPSAASRVRLVHSNGKRAATGG
jgi:gamma-glutamyl-gamma-aminobutyraldehyde dehydrogenase